MSFTIPFIQRLFQSLCRFLDNALKPDAKHTKTTLEQEIILKRNKAFFIACIFTQITYWCDFFFWDGPLAEILVRSVLAVVMKILLLLSNYLDPRILNFTFFFVFLISGITIVGTGPEGATTAFILVVIFPIFTQVITSSYTYYTIQILAQFIYLNTFYQRYLGEMIASNSPQTVLNCLTYSANVVLALQVFVVILIERILSQAQNNAYILEQKKNEAEAQKTILLSFSHELRNLINSLTGNVKLASLENVGSRAKDLLNNAELCGELLLHLINNILDSGKAEIGELDIHAVPVKTYDAFEKIWGICSELIRRKNLGGYMKIPKDLPRTVIIDSHRLAQIFLNLVGNAIKFTDKGSIDITVEWINGEEIVTEECFQPYPFNTLDEHDEGLFEKDQYVSIFNNDLFILNTNSRVINRNLLKPASYVSKGILKMIVSDQGIGMAKKQIDKLFQKFIQVTDDVSKKKLGTGLGLFITKQLCEKMNGQVRAFSEKGKGSSFTFCIPVEVVKDRPQTIEGNNSLIPSISARDLRVMIVDDVVTNHFILKTFFENLEIRVMDIAINGLDAYEKYTSRHFKEGCPEIVAMDLDMPIMNGKEASQKIREFEKQKRLKPCFLVIISGNCLDSEINECLNQGGKICADAFLRKPLRLEDLMRLISSHFLEGQNINSRR